MSTHTNPTPTNSETRTIDAGRRSRLPALALGAILAGLVAAPLPAVAAGDQQIGHALQAATTARAAYAVYFAAAIDDCVSAVRGCGSVLSDGLSTGDGGLETSALLPSSNGAAAQRSERQ